MSRRNWSWTMGLVAAALVAGGCAQEAGDKMSHAEHDVADAWRAERDAIVAEMNEGIEATSRQIENVRARAAELEAEAETEVAEAWHYAADELEIARDAAAREVVKLEQAGADAWESTKEAADEAAEELERFGARAAAFATDEKDAFVAEARAVIEEGERDIAWAREKLAEADDEVREEWRELVDELEERQRKTLAELEKIEEASEDAWGDLRQGFVAAYRDVKIASKEAAEEFGDI